MPSKTVWCWPNTNTETKIGVALANTISKESILWQSGFKMLTVDIECDGVASGCNGGGHKYMYLVQILADAHVRPVKISSVKQTAKLGITYYHNVMSHLLNILVKSPVYVEHSMYHLFLIFIDQACT